MSPDLVAYQWRAVEYEDQICAAELLLARNPFPILGDFVWPKSAVFRG